MSVVIRMQRAGGRNYPFFHVVVADSRRARDGRFLEKLGYYNPLSQPAQVHLDASRVRHWIGRGATPSESVSVLWKQYVKSHPETEQIAPEAAGVSAPVSVAPVAPAREQESEPQGSES